MNYTISIFLILFNVNKKKLIINLFVVTIKIKLTIETSFFEKLSFNLDTFYFIYIFKGQIIKLDILR